MLSVHYLQPWGQIKKKIKKKKIVKKKSEKVSARKEIFSSKHLFGIQQDLNLSNKQKKKGFQENVDIHSHLLDDFFDEIQTSYVLCTC